MNYSTTTCDIMRFKSLHVSKLIVVMNILTSPALTALSVLIFTSLIYSQTTVTDIDGNIYETITIGDQVWMAENLKVTHFRNGDEISKVTDNGSWSKLRTPAYSYYDNDEKNLDTFGCFYNWYAVDDSRGLAPSGWHIPSDEEWKELELNIGMSTTDALSANLYRGSDEGKKLKSVGGWYGGGNGTDDYKFNVLPSGYRVVWNGSFFRLGHETFFWTSTEQSKSSVNVYYRSFYYSKNRIGRQVLDKPHGLSIRCVKD